MRKYIQGKKTQKLCCWENASRKPLDDRLGCTCSESSNITTSLAVTLPPPKRGEVYASEERGTSITGS